MAAITQPTEPGEGKLRYTYMQAVRHCGSVSLPASMLEDVKIMEPVQASEGPELTY